MGQAFFLNRFMCLMGLDELCPTRGPGEGFVRPSLGFRCSKSIVHTDNLFLIW